jgi:hypothetical protein
MKKNQGICPFRRCQADVFMSNHTRTGIPALPETGYRLYGSNLSGLFSLVAGQNQVSRKKKQIKKKLLAI